MPETPEEIASMWHFVRDNIGTPMCYSEIPAYYGDVDWLEDSSSISFEEYRKLQAEAQTRSQNEVVDIKAQVRELLKSRGIPDEMIPR